jgi:hypothetical protein
MHTAMTSPELIEDRALPLSLDAATEIASATLFSDAVVSGWREMELEIILDEIARNQVTRLRKTLEMDIQPLSSK